jgi:16S rRNA (guanine966-N2)-methyltransferase
MPRIIAGRLGSRRIDAPPGSGTRPTADRVREALLPALGAVVPLDGARVLDLYAGSGAVALEALSRGASHAVLVENARTALTVLHRNIAALGVADQCTVVPSDASEWLATAAPPGGTPFSVVFLDPPYKRAVEPDLARLAARGWLAADAVVAVERAARDGAIDWPTGYTPIKQRRYGDTLVAYAVHSHGS